MAWIAVTVTAVGAATSAYGTYQQGKSQQAMADYNAKVAENEALANQYAIDAESRKLAKGQREMKAQQRMSVSSRGGLAEGTDLLALAEQAKVMQLDQLELSRQQTLAGTRGAAQAAMSRYEGKVARNSSRWTAGTTLLKGAGQAASYGISK